MGLPGDWVSYVPVETDAIPPQNLMRFLQFELEDDVPIPFENFQIDMLGTHRTDKKLQGLVVVCDGHKTDALCQLLDLAGGLFLLAIKIGAPVIAALFFVSVGFGLVSKFAPQMNVMIVAFPLKIVAGLFLFGLTLEIIVLVTREYVDGFKRLLMTLLFYAGGG